MNIGLCLTYAGVQLSMHPEGGMRTRSLLVKSIRVWLCGGLLDPDRLELLTRLNRVSLVKLKGLHVTTAATGMAS